MFDDIIAAFQTTNPGYTVSLKKKPMRYYVVIRKDDKVIACRFLRPHKNKILEELNSIVESRREA